VYKIFLKITKEKKLKNKDKNKKNGRNNFVLKKCKEKNSDEL
jgi:hypothetical protein